jgi:hypothetical protein
MLRDVRADPIEEITTGLPEIVTDACYNLLLLDLQPLHPSIDFDSGRNVVSFCLSVIVVTVRIALDLRAVLGRNLHNVQQHVLGDTRLFAFLHRRSHLVADPAGEVLLPTLFECATGLANIEPVLF